MTYHALIAYGVPILSVYLRDEEHALEWFRRNKAFWPGCSIEARWEGGKRTIARHQMEKAA